MWAPGYAFSPLRQRIHRTLLLLAVMASNPALAETLAERVVSLDYCADQYLLKLLPKSRILALSPDAESHFSYMREAAAGIRTVRPLAENILGLRPGLVVRSYGGGPRVTTFLSQTGVEVLQLPYANNLQEIRAALIDVSTSLGVAERGRILVAEMDARLNAIVIDASRRDALYMTPTGVTSGSGTMVHEMLVAAGLTNFQKQAGWRSLPLERLAYEQPDLVVAAFFDETAIQAELWSPMRHPIAKQQLQQQPTVTLHGAWTSCGAWFLLDAIEALAADNVAGSQLK